jgi:uncharacterized protein (UPF0333 family)
MPECSDESAQATLEYVLMLSIMVLLSVMVIQKLIRPGFERLSSAIETRFNDQLFRQGGFHQFPIRR